MKEPNFENEMPLYPKGLTSKDIELINEQCEHQQATSKEQINGFAQAYAEAKELSTDLDRINSLTVEEIEELIMRWAEFVEKQNKTGFRIVAVRFANMNTALDPDNISRAMKSFVELYVDKDFTPVEAYIEFETIHPFKDGNGRVGDLLWKLAIVREGGDWPEELPPDVFGEKNKK